MDLGDFFGYCDERSAHNGFVGGAPDKYLAEDIAIRDVNLVAEVDDPLRGCSVFNGEGFDLPPGSLEHTEKDIIGG